MSIIPSQDPALRLLRSPIQGQVSSTGLVIAQLARFVRNCVVAPDDVDQISTCDVMLGLNIHQAMCGNGLNMES